MGRAERAFALSLGRRAGGANSDVPNREKALWGAFDFANVHISDSFASLALVVFVAVVLALLALLSADCLLARDALSLPVEEATALKAVAFTPQILTRHALGASEQVSEALRAKSLVGDSRTAAA